jgi:PAS domain S-box-containing protein
MDRFAGLRPSSERARTWLSAVLFGVLYLAITRASISLLGSVGVGGFSGPVLWPATGLYLGALLVARRPMWPVLALLALAASLAAHLDAGSSPAVSLGFAAANSAGGLFTALLIRRAATDGRMGKHPLDLVAFVLGGAVAANAVCALSAAGVARYGMTAPFIDSWVRWWSADALAMLVVTPVIAAPLVLRLRSPSNREIAHAAAVVASVVAAAYAVATMHPWDAAGVVGGVLALPFLLSAALRWGPRAAALGVSGVAIAAAYRAAHDGTVFSHGNAVSVQVLAVQGALAMTAIAPLGLSASAAAHGRVKRALAVARERLTRLLDKTADACISVDEDGRITDWSGRAEAMFGWSSADAIGTRPEDTFVPPAAREAWGAALARPAAPDQADAKRVVLPARRRSGQELRVELAVAAASADDGAGADLLVLDVTERERLRGELEQIGDQLTAKAAELDRTAREREELRSTLTRSRAAKAETEQELANTKRALAELERERDDIERKLGATIDARDRALEDSGRERERLQVQLQALDEQLAGVHELVAEGEHELEQAGQRQAEILAELARAEQRAAELEQALAEARQSQATTAAELERARQRQTETDAELGRAQQRQNETDAELEQVRQAQGEATAEAERSNQQIAELEQQLREAHERYAEADAALERSRERQGEIVAELDAARKHSAGVEEALTATRDRQAATEAELSQTAAEVDRMAAELAQLEEQRERVENDLRHAEQAREIQERRWAAEQRRLEAALVATAKSLAAAQQDRYLLEGFPAELIARYDDRGICQYVSAGWREALGYEREELIGRQGSEIVHPDDRPLVRRARAEQSESHFKARLRHKNGQFTPVEAIFRPVRDESGRLVEIETALRPLLNGYSDGHNSAAKPDSASGNGDHGASLLHRLT